MENIEKTDVATEVTERKKPGPKPKSVQQNTEENSQSVLEPENTAENGKEETVEETSSISEKPEEKAEEPSEKEDVKEVETSHHGVLSTNHNYAPGDKVWVAKFSQERESKGFSKIINSYKFIPTQGEIERIIITDKVRYKLKNVAGSNIDEEDVCWTEQECLELCAKKNKRI